MSRLAAQPFTSLIDDNEAYYVTEAVHIPEVKTSRCVCMCVSMSDSTQQDTSWLLWPREKLHSRSAPEYIEILT